MDEARVTRRELWLATATEEMELQAERRVRAAKGCGRESDRPAQ